jgi:hypothetical protein
MSRCIYAVIAAFILVSLAACSKYQNTEWLDIDRGWRVRIEKDYAHFEDAVHGRKATLFSTVVGDTLFFLDDKRAFFGGQAGLSVEPEGSEGTELRTIFDDISVRLVPASDQTEEAFRRTLVVKKLAHANRLRLRPSGDSDFVTITPNEISLLIAAHRSDSAQFGIRGTDATVAGAFLSRDHRNMSDDEIAQSFIPGLARQEDAFIRNELLKGVPAIRSMLTTLGRPRNYRFLVDSYPGSQSPYSLPSHYRNGGELGRYDFSTSSFTFTHDRTPCEDARTSTYPYQVYRHPVGLTDWGTSANNRCRIEVKDRALAKVIEAARASQELDIEAEVFFQVTGEMLWNDRFGLTPVFEALSVRVRLHNSRGEPLGAAEGFTITPNPMVSPGEFAEEPSSPDS